MTWHQALSIFAGVFIGNVIYEVVRGRFRR